LPALVRRQCPRDSARRISRVGTRLGKAVVGEDS
jgi:hypothetical protein